MDASTAKLESLQMLKQWSIWLLTLESAICALLWNSLDVEGMRRVPEVFLHLGWLSFGLSVITATILVNRIPMLIEGLAEDVSDRSILLHPTKILGANIRLRFLVRAEYFLFLLGILFLFIFVLNQGLGVISPTQN